MADMLNHAPYCVPADEQDALKAFQEWGVGARVRGGSRKPVHQWSTTGDVALSRLKRTATLHVVGHQLDFLVATMEWEPWWSRGRMLSELCVIRIRPGKTEVVEVFRWLTDYAKSRGIPLVSAGSSGARPSTGVWLETQQAMAGLLPMGREYVGVLENPPTPSSTNCVE